MLNINEEDLKKAIVEKAADEILKEDDDLSDMIRQEVKKRLEWAITALQNRIAELTKSSSQQDADKVKADLLSSLVEIVDAVIASDEEGLIEHSETIINARAAIDAARKEQA